MEKRLSVKYEIGNVLFMNILKIEINPSHYESGDFHEILLFIDGRNLIDILKNIEKKYDPRIAGQYKGLILEYTSPEHFLGKPKILYGEEENKTPLLDCQCGCNGCWTFASEIIIEEDNIIWKNFEQIHRSGEFGDKPWCYEELGFFIFNKEQYFQEINKLKELPKPLPWQTDITIAPENSQLDIGQQHTVSISVKNMYGGQPIPHLNMILEITGANPMKLHLVTDETGKAAFSYIGTHEGEDTLLARADDVNLCSTARAYWAKAKTN